MRADIIVLNSKDRKAMRQQLIEQFGVTDLPDKVFFCLNKKERVYITNRDSFDLDQEDLRINAFGLYFGTFMKDGFRLSLEGAQLLKDQLKKNVVAIDEDQRNRILKGMDLDVTASDGNHGTVSRLNGEYVILRHDSDIIGCAKVKDSTILNYIPKSKQLRRIFPEE